MFLDKYIEIAKKNGRMEKMEKVASGGEELGILMDTREKTAGYTLANDTQQWNKEIMKQLHEGKDWLDPDSFYIRWKQSFDGEKGYALGVIVLEKEGTEISVPLIIKDYELQPFDVFFSPDEEKIMPLTEKTVEDAFYNTEMADEVVDKRKRNKSPLKDIFPPRMGKYVYASMDISEADKKEFIERLKDKELLKIANDNKEFLKVAKSFKDKDPIEIGDYFEKEKTASLVIEPEDTLGYKLIFDDGKTKTASYKKASDSIREHFGLNKKKVDSLLKSVDKGNKEALSNTKKEKEVQDMSVDVKRIDRATRVRTKDKFGNDVSGFAIPRVYSFQTGKIAEEALLIDGSRNIVAHEPKILGKPVQEGMQLKDLLRRHVIQMPTRDSVISFMWFDSKYNDFVATQPIRIVDYEEVEGMGRIYSVMTKLGSYHKVTLGEKIKKPDFAKNNKYNAIILPEDAKLLMYDKENEVKLINSVDKFKRKMEKEASVMIGRYFKNVNEVEIKSSGLNKTASPREIELELLKEGFSKKDTEGILKDIADKKDTKIYYKETKTKEASRREEILDNMVDDIRDIRNKFDLVKIAADLESIEAVDKVLSLNFINKKNLARIFEALPDLKQTTLKLAELLLYARIGNIGVPESSIKEAMTSLQYLVEKLEGYEV